MLYGENINLNIISFGAYKLKYNFLWYSTAAPLYSCRSHSTCSTKFSTEYPGTVRVLHVFKGEPYHGVLVPLPRIPLLDLITNISRVPVAKQLQLDVVIHLPLEFAIRRHLTVEISASAHLHPRVPRVPRAVIHEYTKSSYLKLKPRH